MLPATTSLALSTSVNSTLDFSLIKKLVGLGGHLPISFPDVPKLQYLHLGCGDKIIQGFINVDFLPGDDRIVGWNLLDPWPEALAGSMQGVFSEDVLEHFYYEEQMYFLCEANLCLREEGINRVLMPSFDKVIACLDSDGNATYWRNLYMAETPVDIVNAMLRHSGHRWLHNSHSLSVLAEKCGYKAIPTSCAESTDPALSNLNVRNEENSLSFGTDLKKVNSISRLRLPPAKISNATLVQADEDGAFYRSTSNDPMIIYNPPALDTAKIILLNARCFNILPPFEHNITKFYFKENEKSSFYIDRALLSVPYNNFVQGGIIHRLMGENSRLGAVRVDPSEAIDTLFYVGNMDIFFFA